MDDVGMQHCAFKYLIGFHCNTCGLDGDNLGSDEAETVHIGWVVVEADTGKVVAIHHSFVCPQEVAKINGDLLKERGLGENDLLSAPSFAEVLQQFEAYAATKLPSYGQQAPGFVLVTDGQAPLRQLVHPEAFKKGIALSNYYSYFFDIRKEFRRLLNNNENLNSLQDIMKLCDVEPNTVESPLVAPCYNLGAVISKLVIENNEKGLKCLREPELVKLTLEHGICTKDDDIDSATVIRARGLPWQSSDQDVANFFVGLNIAKGGVALCLSLQGRRNGEALVRFENHEQRDFALKRHRHFMGNRYIEVYRATGEDFISIAAGTNKEAVDFLSKTEAIIIRMRGLPYDCTKEQITKFFEEGENGVEVLGGEKGIMFVIKADGKASGDAFVQFANKEEAKKALSKNKETIGTRYIELFQTTTAEVQQVCSRSMDPVKPDTNGLAPTPTGLIGMIPGAAGLQSITNSALLPQQLMISGSRKDCIRLRGLQYEAKVEHILDFLGEFAKHIVYQGVHMIFNAQGHPSGEAFIQMDSEHAAAMAAADRHNKYMQIPGKKQRYIEVFQCSADDMNLVLTGPGSATGALSPALFPAAAMAAAQSRPLLSPGGSFLHAQQQQALAAAGFLPGLTQPALFGSHPAALQNGNLAAAQAAALAASGGVDALTSLRLLHGAGRLPFLPGGVASFLPTVGAAGGPGGNAVVYFPYPSPPVSPTSYYATAAHMQQAPGVVLMRGLPFNMTTADVVNLLQGFDLTSDNIHIQRTAAGQPTGEALITFPTRMDAERAILEKRATLVGRQIELYLCGI